MKTIHSTLIALLFFTLPHLATASEYAMYQNDIMKPYGFYKKSLGLTSKAENKDKAIKVVENFNAEWAVIIEKYADNSPTEFNNIANFKEKISRPLAVGENALALLQAGDVSKAHSDLEEIRYLLWKMRVDAGIVSLNDKINDFHEAMEIILDEVAESKTPEELGKAGERYGAWVDIKWAEVAQMSFSGENKTAFIEAGEAGNNAIKELREACRKGDNEAAKKAGGNIKNAYKQIFFLPETR